MHSISRRGFVISATTAAAAFGLIGPLEFFTPAFAQKPDPKLTEKGFFKFKVGDIEVTQVSDGIWEKAHDEKFIKDVTVDQTKAALKASGLTDAHVPIPFTVTVIKVKDKYVMFDSGTGAQGAPTAGLIVKKEMLKAAGIDPSKISTIVVTHYHGDHIFGLMAKDTNAQLFPNAEIIMPEAEYKYWTDAGVFTTLAEPRHGLAKRIQATFPTWKNIKQVAAGKEALPGVRAVASYGHTPGHTSYLVSSKGKQLMVLGDVSNVPALNLKNPNWYFFDQDFAVAEASRRKMFDRVVAEKLMVTGYHFGMPGAGTVSKDGKGYAFVPVKA